MKKAEEYNTSAGQYQSSSGFYTYVYHTDILYSYFYFTYIHNFDQTRGICDWDHCKQSSISNLKYPYIAITIIIIIIIILIIIIIIIIIFIIFIINTNSI